MVEDDHQIAREFDLPQYCFSVSRHFTAPDQIARLVNVHIHIRCGPSSAKRVLLIVGDSITDPLFQRPST